MPRVEQNRLILRPLECQRRGETIRIGNIRCVRYRCHCTQTQTPNSIIHDEEDPDTGTQVLRIPVTLDKDIAQDLLHKALEYVEDAWPPQPAPTMTDKGKSANSPNTDEHLTHADENRRGEFFHLLEILFDDEEDALGLDISVFLQEPDTIWSGL